MPRRRRCSRGWKRSGRRVQKGPRAAQWPRLSAAPRRPLLLVPQPLVPQPLVPQLGSLASPDGAAGCGGVPRTQERAQAAQVRTRGGGAGPLPHAAAADLALSPRAQAGLPPGVGHYKMALRACTRDRRWEAASALLHRVPAPMWEADAALCRSGLKACADAAEPQLAARLVALLGRGGGVGPDEFAWWLQACRVAADAHAAGAAWAAYRASGGAPSELCYALRLGTLYLA